MFKQEYIRKILKNIPPVLVLIISIFTWGCYSAKEVSSNDIFIQKETRMYFVHAGDSSWLLVSPDINDGVFRGLISSGTLKPERSSTIHLFIAPESAVIREEDHLSFPVSNIAKAEAEKLDKAGTFQLATFAVIIAIPLVFFISLLISGGYDM